MALRGNSRTVDGSTAELFRVPDKFRVALLTDLLTSAPMMLVLEIGTGLGSYSAQPPSQGGQH